MQKIDKLNRIYTKEQIKTLVIFSHVFALLLGSLLLWLYDSLSQYILFFIFYISTLPIFANYLYFDNYSHTNNKIRELENRIIELEEKLNK